MHGNTTSKDASARRLAFDLVVWSVSLLTAIALLAYEVGL
jgi:hypothetical protein